MVKIDNLKQGDNNFRNPACRLAGIVYLPAAGMFIKSKNNNVTQHGIYPQL